MFRTAVVKKKHWHLFLWWPFGVFLAKKNVVGEYLWKDVEKQQWFEPGQWPRHSLLREAEALPSAPGRAGSAGSGTGLAANWPPGLSVAWLLWTSANSSVKQKLVPGRPVWPSSSRS